jgi:hypothetical protein
MGARVTSAPMNLPRYAVWLVLVGGALGAARADTVPLGAKAVGITAVCSRVSKDYVRARYPDGSFKPEEYAFGDGGLYPGTFKDDSIDRVKFLDVAQVLAAALRAQNYLPARALDSERLLIMVHWGTTNVEGTGFFADGNLALHAPGSQEGGRPSSSPRAVENARLSYLRISGDNLERDHVDFMNAKLLGYDSEDLIGTFYGATVGHMGIVGAHRDELVDEIEDNRYFVVLVAYDFQLFRQGRQKKVVWESRFSINEPNNDFSRALPIMAKHASRYFGQDSHGLLRRPVPEGQVEFGEPKSLNVIEPAGR